MDTEFALRDAELGVVAMVQRALEEDRLALDFQRLFPIHSDSAPRIELLLRLYDEQGNSVPPTAFLPALEHFNLAVQLDRWVVASALSWLQQNKTRLNDINHCSINLSAASLCDGEFLDFLHRRFDSSSQLAQKVCFEINETSGLASPAESAEFIHRLREKGCRFALDNVGAGWGAFHYLRSVPVGMLKISGTLITNMLNDDVDYCIVKSIADIGHAMGKSIVAASVENAAVHNALCELGIDFNQGHFLGSPRPLREFEFN